MPAARRTLRAAVGRAGPGFTLGVAATSAGTLAYGVVAAPLVAHRYLHLVSGVTWLGANLLLGVVIGPVLGALDDATATAVYGRLAPKFAVLLPAMLVAALGTGIPLAVQIKPFPHGAAWLALFALVTTAGVALAFGRRFDAWRDPRWRVPAAVGVLATAVPVALTVGEFGMTARGMALTLVTGALLTVVGLGVVLAGDLRVCHELLGADPDPATVAAIGRRNLALARVQVFLQLAIVVSVL